MNHREDRPAFGSGALFNLGFRPFFLGATIFSVAVMIMWMLVYTLSVPLTLRPLSPLQWHAHEMIYGYSLAVIAGFLLTAVRNWTGIQTIHGPALLGLFCVWAAARLSMLFGTALIHAAAFLDVLFVASLVGAVAVPLCRAGSWKHAGILSKLILLGVGSVVFYIGCFGYLAQGVYWGLYGGLYLIIGLMLTIGRRVIPFFIENGVGYPVTLFNSKSIDVASLLLFLALFIVELFFESKHMVPYLAGALFAVNAVRLAGWHTPGLWRKPLLWSLYAAYGFVVAGFGLLALSEFAGVSRFVAIHSFAYGGIGLITLSMMARVSIGHTGRNVHDPPRSVVYALAALAAGALFRVVFPIALPQYYAAWIAVSQFLWIAAFLALAVFLFPLLTAPRTDGRFG